MNDGPLIIEVPEPPAWPEGPAAGLIWPEQAPPPPIAQSDAAVVLADFACETILAPQLVETVVLPVSAERGPAGPPQIYIGNPQPLPIVGYTLLWAKPADPPTGDPLDHEPTFIVSP